MLLEKILFLNFFATETRMEKNLIDEAGDAMCFHVNTIFEKVNEISSENAALRAQVQIYENNNQLVLQLVGENSELEQMCNYYLLELIQQKEVIEELSEINNNNIVNNMISIKSAVDEISEKIKTLSLNQEPHAPQAHDMFIELPLGLSHTRPVITVPPNFSSDIPLMGLYTGSNGSNADCRSNSLPYLTDTIYTVTAIQLAHYTHSKSGSKYQYFVSMFWKNNNNPDTYGHKIAKVGSNLEFLLDCLRDRRHRFRFIADAPHKIHAYSNRHKDLQLRMLEWEDSNHDLNCSICRLHTKAYDLGDKRSSNWDSYIAALRDTPHAQ